MIEFNKLDFLCSLEEANFDFFKNDPNHNFNPLTKKVRGSFGKRNL